jgi:hypothetical protein
MDSMTMIVVAVMVIASIAAALFKTLGLGSLRRIVTIEGPQPIGRMMTQRGLSPDDAAGREYDLVMAMNRCASCKSAEQCRDSLDAGRGRDARAFCANASFFARLEVGARRARGTALRLG